MVKGETKKFGRDGVGFGVVEEGEGGNKVVKVFAMVVFDSKVIYHQREDNVTGNVTEETGGGGRVKAVGGKVGEETVLGQLACLLQSVHRFVDAEKEVGFAGGVRLNEGVKTKMGEDRVGEKMGGDFDKLGLGKGGAEIVVSQVDRPEEGMRRDNRV